MISTTHIVSGAALGLAVGTLIPNPIAAVPVALFVGVISHHLFDKIPHTDPGSWRQPNEKTKLKQSEIAFAIPDNLLGTSIVLMIFFTIHPSWPMLFGAAGANFPDIFHHPPLWSDTTRYGSALAKRYFSFHETHHWTARGKLIPLGIVTNLIIIGLSLWYLL
jgi:hypothetical protein